MTSNYVHLDKCGTAALLDWLQLGFLKPTTPDPPTTKNPDHEKGIVFKHMNIVAKSDL